LNFLVCFLTWSEEDKLYYSESESDIPSENDKSSQSFQMLTPSSDAPFFRV